MSEPFSPWEFGKQNRSWKDAVGAVVGAVAAVILAGGGAGLAGAVAYWTFMGLTGR